MFLSSTLVQVISGAILCAALMAVPVPSSGFWRRGYVANLPIPTAAAWNAPSTSNVSSLAAGQVGLGAYLGTNVPREDLPRALPAVESLPVTWVRTEIPWAGVEPHRGEWVWDPWDQVVDSLRARDCEILGMLCYWSGWVEPYSDEAITRFGEYAERLARRYRGRVRAWEVWNEPNERTFWQSTSERYVRLLRAACEGVRRGDPDALVVGGSLSGVDVAYLQELLAHGAGQWMDALSVHPYSFGWGPERSQLIRELRGMAEVWRKQGGRGGLWVTEIGVNSLRDRGQANQTERTLILLLQSGVVDVSFWYCLYLTKPSGYALYRPDWQARPAAETFRRVLSRLNGAVPAGSGAPPDLLPPWAAGNPHCAVPLQSWCFRTPDGVERITWSAGGPVALDSGGASRLVTADPYWEHRPRNRP